jgi:hypothetical protein
LESAYLTKQLSQVWNPNPPFEVRISTPQSRRDFRAGEKALFQVSCDEEAHLLILKCDSAGDLRVIFPNRYLRPVPARTVIEIAAADARRSGVTPEPVARVGGQFLKVIATSEPLDLRVEGLLFGDSSSSAIQTPETGPAAPISPARGLTEQILTALRDRSERGGLRWSEDSIMFRIHP